MGVALTSNKTFKIQYCVNNGDITTTYANNGSNYCYTGGILGQFYNNTANSDLSHCYSTGKVVRKSGTSSYCFGILGGQSYGPDFNNAGYGNYYVNHGTTIEKDGYGPVESAAALNDKIAELGEDYYEAGATAPVLKWTTAKKVKVTKGTCENGTLKVDSEIYPYSLVKLGIKCDPGYALTEYDVEGDGLIVDGNMLVAWGDVTVNATTHAAASSVISIPTAENNEYTVAVTKDGIVADGDGYKDVTDYAVKHGDTVYESGVIKVAVIVNEDVETPEPGLSYINEYVVTCDNGKVITENSEFQVGAAANTNLTIDVTLFRNSFDLDEDADTAWYDDADLGQTTFHISTAAQMVGISKLVRDGETFAGETVYLDKDIDLGGFIWSPIGRGGSTNYKFEGTFDGQNHKITGLYGDWHMTATAATACSVPPAMQPSKTSSLKTADCTVQYPAVKLIFIWVVSLVQVLPA